MFTVFPMQCYDSEYLDLLLVLQYKSEEEIKDYLTEIIVRETLDKTIADISNNNLSNANMLFNTLQKRLNIPDGNGYYPIHYLCINIHIVNPSIFKFLIENGSKISYDDELVPVIGLLIKYNKLDLNLLELFEKYNYDFNFIDNNNCNLWHYFAVTKKTHIDLIEFIYKKNTNINLENNFTETPLLTSTQYNNHTLIKFLIENGADINKINSNENNVLMYACMNNNIEIVKLLVEKGVDINKEDNQKDTSFMYACGCDNKKNLKIELIEFLYKNGANINQVSAEGHNALHYSCGCNHSHQNPINKEIVKYLLSIGVKPDLLDQDKKIFMNYIVDIDKSFIKDIIKTFDLIRYPIIRNNIVIKYEFLKDLVQLKCKYIEQTDETCFICKDEFDKDSTIISCSKQHYFDYDCIIEWFKESENFTCPYCLNEIDVGNIIKIK